MRDQAKSLRDRAYRWLLKRGERGATDEEMQLASRMNPSTQRPRRIELVDLGLAVDSGLVRKTKTGRKAVVWRAVPPEELGPESAT
jgi:hypothetical protein